MINILLRIARLHDSSNAASILAREDIRLVEQSGMFDYRFYRERYSDIKDLPQQMALAHFVFYGGNERRSPSALFDTNFYLTSNPDVASLGTNPLLHYLKHGRNEGRLPTKDFRVRGFPKRIQKDASEIANSGLFSYPYYLKAYPDVAAHKSLDPLEHFCLHGWKEGRNPNSLFSTSFYLRKHIDVAYAGVNPFVHWIKHGRAEGRKISVKNISPPTSSTRLPRPSIIFVSHDASRSGAPSVLISLMRWLQANTKVDFAIAVGVHGPLDAVFEEIAPVFYFEDHQHDHIIMDLREFCGDNVQYIYINTIVSVVYAESFRFLNAVFVAHIHEMEGIFRLFDQRFRDFSRYCVDFIAVSEAVKDCIERRVAIDTSRIKIVRPFIEPYVSGFVSDWRRPPGKYKIIFGCGAVEKRKGFDFFCNVGRRLIEARRTDFKMYWIGSDVGTDLNATLEIEKAGVAQVVVSLGPKPSPRDLFKDGDIFLLPSREDPFPLVCLEAADCALPIICFDEYSGGMHRFVEHDAGIVVRSNDVKAMTGAVTTLLDDIRLCKKLGFNAQTKVRAMHYVNSAAPQIWKLLSDTVHSDAKTRLDAFYEQIDRSEIVSFDIFDTLVTRLISDPNVAFDLVEFEYSKYEPAATSFFNERMNAAGSELESHAGDVDDVSIDRIYDRMAFYRRVAVEKEMEINLCVPHPMGKKLFEYAKNKSKIIFITSDMYLDENTIISILRKCGFEDWHRILLSSTTGFKKSTGRLFSMMIDKAWDHGVAPGRITHFGDNWSGDIHMARQNNIRAIHFKPLQQDDSSVVSLPSTEVLKLSQIGRIWNATCTQIFRLWINEHPTLSTDLLVKLGFQVTGPLAAMFAMHVRRTADKRKVKKIFFLARDGRIVKEAFDKIYGEELEGGRYKSSYIHLSRATVVSATFDSKLTANDLYFLTEALHTGQKAVKYFICRAGLDPHNEHVRRALRQHDLDETAVLTWDDRDRLVNFFLELSSDITLISDQSRVNLLRFLEDNDFLTTEPILIVDVGWLLSIQSRLTRVMRQSRQDTNLFGAYLGSREGIDKSVEHDCLLFEAGEPADFAALIEQHITLIEILFSAAEPAAAGLTSELHPQVIFRKPETTSREFHVAQRLQFGARSFIDSFSANSIRKFFPQMVSRDFAMHLLSALLASKNEGLIATFSDFEIALGGGTRS